MSMPNAHKAENDHVAQRPTVAAATHDHERGQEVQNVKRKSKSQRGSRAGADAQRKRAQATPVHLQVPTRTDKTIVYATTPSDELDRILELQTEFIEHEYSTSRPRDIVYTDDWSQLNLILASFSAYEKALFGRPTLHKLFDVVEFVAYACVIQQLRLATQCDAIGVHPAVPDSFAQSPERFLLGASLPIALVPFVEALRPHISAEGKLAMYVPYTYHDPVDDADIDERHPFVEDHRPVLRGARVLTNGVFHNVPDAIRAVRPCYVELLRLRDAALAGNRFTLSAREINEVLGFEATCHAWPLNRYADTLQSAGRVLGSTPFGYLFRINSLVPRAFEAFPIATNFFRRLWTTMKEGPAPCRLAEPGVMHSSPKESPTRSLLTVRVIAPGATSAAISQFWVQFGFDPVPAITDFARIELAEVGAAYAHTGDAGPGLRDLIRRLAESGGRL